MAELIYAATFIGLCGWLMWVTHSTCSQIEKIWADANARMKSDGTNGGRI